MCDIFHITPMIHGCVGIWFGLFFELTNQFYFHYLHTFKWASMWFDSFAIHTVHQTKYQISNLNTISNKHFLINHEWIILYLFHYACLRIAYTFMSVDFNQLSAGNKMSFCAFPWPKTSNKIMFEVWNSFNFIETFSGSILLKLF